MNKKVIQEIIVETTDNEKRLDIFLAEKLDITRSGSQRLIREGSVLFDGQKIVPKREVTEGEKYVIVETRAEKAVSIPVLFEDDNVIVIDKPCGVTVHPAPGEKEKTIIELLGQKLIVVHRLDKGTSGVMILAKNDESADNLKKQFAKRTVKKEYIALVTGDIEDDNGSIELDLARSKETRGKIVPTHEGRVAITDFSVSKRFSKYTLVSAFPRTGRTHQIRTHFAAIGHPLYGDVRYGNDKAKARIFLHAHKLTIRLPETSKSTTFTSALPLDLTGVLTQLQD